MSPENEDKIDPALLRVMEIPDDQELPDDFLCDVMIRALESPQLLIRASAMNQLVILGKKDPKMAIPKILRALDPAIDFWTVRFGSVEALGEIANQATIKPLIEYLKKDKDQDFRAMVAKQLGVMGEIAIEAGPALIEALYNNESSEIRENASRAIGLIQISSAVEPMIQALKNERDEYTRREMSWSLGELKSPLALSILITTLKDSDKETRANAAEALGKIKQGDAVLPLLQVTKDIDVDVQTKAIWALKQFSSDIIISEIEKAAHEDELVAIQYYDEYLFNIDNEEIARKVQDIKTPIILDYKEKLGRIKTELTGCKVFVEESFQKLNKLSKKDLALLIDNKIPSVESRIANVSLYEFRKHKWIANDLYFDLEQIENLYKESGIMISELRDNVLLLQKKKKERPIPPKVLGNDSETP
ncbi:MAG: HEAT repeat domain-containing protein [Candidatus Hodarchaeota archaeon]